MRSASSACGVISIGAVAVELAGRGFGAMPPPDSGRPGEADALAAAGFRVASPSASACLSRGERVDGFAASISAASMPENSATRRVRVLNSIPLRNATSSL